MNRSLIIRWIVAAIVLPFMTLMLHPNVSTLSENSITKSHINRIDEVHTMTLWLITCDTKAEEKPWFLDGAKLVQEGQQRKNKNRQMRRRQQTTTTTAEDVEIQLRNVCENRQWEGWITKSIGVREFAEELLNKVDVLNNQTYVIYLDSDVIMNSFIKNVAHEIVQRYHELVDPGNHSIVIGAEPACWIGRACQVEDFDWVYPGVNRTSCPLFVNAGMVMGDPLSVFGMMNTLTAGGRDTKYEDLFRNVTTDIAKTDDQAKLGVWYSSHKDVAILDTQGFIFRNLMFGYLNSSQEGRFSCGRDAVESCGANVPPISGHMDSTTFEFVMDPVPGCPSHPRPIFLHGNGPARAICRELYDRHQDSIEQINAIGKLSSNDKQEDELIVISLFTCETRPDKHPWFFEGVKLARQLQSKDVHVMIKPANICEYSNWEGWITKLMRMKFFLARMRKDPGVKQYVVYVDADVVINSFLPNLASEIMRRFHEIVDPGNHSILFGATSSCSIGRQCLTEDFDWLYPGVKRTNCAKFLSPEFYMGEVRDVRRMVNAVTRIVGDAKFEEMYTNLPEGGFRRDDRALLSAWYVAHKDVAVLDTKASIFRNLLVGFVDSSKRDDEKWKWSCGVDSVLSCGLMDPPITGKVDSKSLEFVMDPVPGCQMEPKPVFLHENSHVKKIIGRQIYDDHNKAMELFQAGKAT